MLTEITIAVGLIAGAGALFILLRGGVSPQYSARKRQVESHRRRREQVREADSSTEGSGTKDSGMEDTNTENSGRRPGKDAISKWSRSE